MFVRFQVGSGSGNAPVITSTAVASATQGAPYSYQIMAADVDGDALTYSLTSAPTGMSVNAASGLVSWTPAAGQTGSQAVTAKVADVTGLSASQSFTIAVANVNDAPLANADSYLMMQGGTLNVAAQGVLANDSDPDGDPLSAVSSYAPGYVFNLASDGSFTYMPPAAFSGAASFEYRAADGQGGVSAPAMVNITVQANRAPAMGDDASSATVRQGAVTPYPEVVINVLANDADPDVVIDPANTIDPASIFLTTAPNKGGWAIANTNGTISYRPKPGFVGTETFRYKVRDTQGLAPSAGAYVRVNVQSGPVPNQPPVTGDDTATAPLRVAGVTYPPVVINVLANDSDPDTASNPTNTIDPASVFLTTTPDQGGWAAVNANGSISYRPMAGFVGVEILRYKVRDSAGLASNPGAYVRVTVGP